MHSSQDSGVPPNNCSKQSQLQQIAPNLVPVDFEYLQGYSEYPWGWGHSRLVERCLPAPTILQACKLTAVWRASATSGGALLSLSLGAGAVQSVSLWIEMGHSFGLQTCSTVG